MAGSLGGFSVNPAPAQVDGMGAKQGAPANQAGMAPAATGFQPAQGSGKGFDQPAMGASSQMQPGGNMAAPQGRPMMRGPGGIRQGANQMGDQPMNQGFGQTEQPGFQGGPAQANPQDPRGTGAPNQSGPGPTTNNEQTGNFNTGYINPSEAAVHSINGGPAYDQRVTDDYYNQQTRNLDPQWQQRQGDQDAQLANMGLSRGSAAWQRESDNLSRQRNDAYQTAQSDAIQRGGAESSRLQNAEMARGNFANQAQQQDYMNRIGSQAAQNTALGQQQNAAQGWESFRTQRYGADQGLKGAEANASAAQANSRAAQATARENAQLQHQLGTRQQEMHERGQAFDQFRAMERDPYELQNLQMQGMYPQQQPSYGSYQGGTSMPQNQSSYADQINQGTSQGNASIAGGLGSFGGYLAQNYGGGQQPQQLGGGRY